MPQSAEAKIKELEAKLKLLEQKNKRLEKQLEDTSQEILAKNKIQCSMTESYDL